MKELSRLNSGEGKNNKITNVCSVLQYTAIYSNILQYTAIYSNI